MACRFAVQVWFYSQDIPEFYSVRSANFVFNVYQNLELIFTVRNSSCGQVMFSQTCVKNSVTGGVHHLPPGQTLPG